MLFSLWPLLLVAAGVALWIGIAPGAGRDFDMLVDRLTDLRRTPGAPALIVAVLIGLFVVSVPILPTASALGLVFGTGAGIVYTLIAGYAAALILFGVGRAMGRPAVQRFAGPRIRGLDERFSRRGVLTIVALRFTPLMPFFVINLLAGSSRITWRDFILGTVFGLTPTIVGLAFIGGSTQIILTDPSAYAAASLIAGVFALTALAWITRIWLRRRKLDRLEAMASDTDE